MTLSHYRKHFTQQLTSIYPLTEIDSFFFILTEEFLNLKRIDVVINPDLTIEVKTLDILNNAMYQLEKEIPIQYILNKTTFFGLSFIVNKHTLIPRPETEELVSWILDEIPINFMHHNSQNIKTRILDIGTGSGCIPIALAKKLPKAIISSIDISEEAIKIAQQNAQLNKVQIQFFNLDILSTNISNLNTDLVENESLNPTNKFHIIVSNPPYVRNLEKTEIQPNVLQHEPHEALFVEDDNPLIFYDKIAELAKIHLHKNGFVFFEINQYLGNETIHLLKQKGFKKILLKKDLFGNDRMIQASF